MCNYSPFFRIFRIDFLKPISSDGNAEKLSDHYEPHVCLTHDALVTLLDNHGPEFSTPWELPVWVKVNSEKGQPFLLSVFTENDQISDCFS